MDFPLTPVLTTIDEPEVDKDERGDGQEHDRDRVPGDVDFVDGVGGLEEIIGFALTYT